MQTIIENQKDLGSNYCSVLCWAQQEGFKIYSKNTTYVLEFKRLTAACERVHTRTFLANPQRLIHHGHPKLLEYI